MTTVEEVMERLKKGSDPLDAAIDGVAVVEADPKDHSVGYGGIPNPRFLLPGHGYARRSRGSDHLSGLPFKIPGRVGDTPILGGGLYLDNEVGACVSTGTGEINLLNGSSFMVVDNLRRGMGIKDACVDACKRIKKTLGRNRHFTDAGGRLNSGVAFYCMTKDGKFGGVGLGAASAMVIHDGEAAREVALESVEI